MTKEYKYIDFSKFEHKAIKNDPDFVGEFKGYAAEWDIPDRGTHMSDEDVIHKGAFEEQCREWKVDPSQVKGSIDHNLSKLGAVFTNLYEDEKGLYCEGKFLNTTKGRDLYVEVKALHQDTEGEKAQILVFAYDLWEVDGGKVVLAAGCPSDDLHIYNPGVTDSGCNPSLEYNTTSRDLFGAYPGYTSATKAARQARFEHGQVGAPVNWRGV